MVRLFAVVRLIVIWTGIGFVLAVLLSAALPAAFGDRSMVVRSGSMTPAIRTGDVIVVHPIAPTGAEVGDIVTFQDPDGSGRLIVHRVRAIERHGDQLAFTTQGDANSTQEHWNVPLDGKIGSVLYRVPKLGLAVNRISSPLGYIGLMIVPALLLAVSLLRSIWRSGPRGEDPDELAA
jgi:signal peptidase